KTKDGMAAGSREMEVVGLDAMVVSPSGCGTTVKDYGFMLCDDPDWSGKAARISSLARDITEIVAELGLLPAALEGQPSVAYHSACSMQHGQKLDALPRELLRDAGFELREVAE